MGHLPMQGAPSAWIGAGLCKHPYVQGESPPIRQAWVANPCHCRLLYSVSSPTIGLLTEVFA